MKLSALDERKSMVYCVINGDHLAGYRILLFLKILYLYVFGCICY